MPSPCASSALLGPFRFDTSRCGEVAHNACQRSDDTGMDMFTSTRASSVTGSLYASFTCRTTRPRTRSRCIGRSLNAHSQRYVWSPASHTVLSMPCLTYRSSICTPWLQIRQHNRDNSSGYVMGVQQPSGLTMTCWCLSMLLYKYPVIVAF